MNPFVSKRFMQLFDTIDQSAQNGGDDRDRTGDPLLAKQVLSQLSYIPSALNLPAGPHL